MALGSTDGQLIVDANPQPTTSTSAADKSAPRNISATPAIVLAAPLHISAPPVHPTTPPAEDVTSPTSASPEPVDNATFTADTEENEDTEESEEEILPRGVGDAILNRLRKLSGPTRAAEVRRLHALTEFEMVRENNIASNQALMDELNLRQGITGMFPPPRASSDTNTESSSSCTPVPEGGSDDEMPQDGPAPPEGSVTAAEVEPTPVDLSDAPDWLRAQYTSLRGENIDVQDVPTWESALGHWIQLERSLSFAKPVSATLGVVKLVLTRFIACRTPRDQSSYRREPLDTKCAQRAHRPQATAEIRGNVVEVVGRYES